jgi:predicted N-acetyltransferase YhbS
MNTNDVIIRLENINDYRTVENLVRESFWNVYRPGCTEHFVLMKLRSDPDFMPDLDFVMEKHGRIIGQNIFMRTCIAADDGRQLPILTMGLICIANDLKGQGYGKLLLDYSLEKAAKLGYKAVCFEGNIDFYGKSGFVVASTRGIRYHGLPEGMEADFFLCKELEAGYFDGITGEYATPQGYFAAEQNPEEFATYDAGFPAKEKLVRPGQLGQEQATIISENAAACQISSKTV